MGAEDGAGGFGGGGWRGHDPQIDQSLHFPPLTQLEAWTAR